jgi:peptidoglycan/LPS O-acetylase OafA/YrhL
MAALLPLIGGVLLARFAANRTTVIAGELVLYALAATVLISTAPDHGHSYGSGVILSLVLAPLCVLAVVLGSLWRNRRATIQTAGS